MALLVQSQVVGAGEAALAVGALERLDARVLPEVSCQFVGTSELPRAAFPHALVGFLAWTTGEKEEKFNTFNRSSTTAVISYSVFTYTLQK